MKELTQERALNFRMLVWILMGLDLIALFALTLAQLNVVFLTQLLVMSAGYLILKGLLFRDIMSILDSVIGVYILFVVLFHFSSFFYYIALGWFLYKLLFTFIQ